MKYFSQIKKQAVALSMALALGLALSVSSNPVYGSATSSSSLIANGTHEAPTFVVKASDDRRICFYYYIRNLLGGASNSNPPSYPSNVLDR